MIPSPPGTLLGRRVRLHQATPADAEALFAAIDHDECWAHVRGRPATAHELASAFGQPDRISWVVTLTEQLGGLPAGTVVGTTSYLDFSGPDRRIEIGSTAYSPDVWGTVVNPDCKRTLMAWAFEAGGCGRVQLKTDIRNLRSQAAIERLGAVREGVLRNYQVRQDGTLRDTVIYSVTDAEWPTVRDGLDARLG